MKCFNHYTWRYYIISLLSSFFVLSSSYSQVVPNAGQELRIQQQQKFFKNLPKTLPNTDPLIEEKKQKKEVQSIISIKKFVFTGEITIFTEQQLQSMVSELAGKKVFLSVLIEMVDKITLKYRDKGYLLAKALLPPQDITEGLITIHIKEGTLDTESNGVQINSQDIRLNKSFAKRIFIQSVKPGSVIHQESLERGALLLNDLPGVKASANLEPGSKPGTTRVVMDILETALFKPRIAWDNTGSRTTGAYKGSFALDINDLTGYGDQTSVFYQGSLDGGAFHYTSISGKIPLGYSGFKLGGTFQYLAYEAGKEFEALEVKGDAIQWGINAEYPVIRSRKTNLWLRGGFEQKILQDEALGLSTNHKFLNIGTLGFIATHTDEFINGGYTQGSLSAYYGYNDLTGLKPSFKADQSNTGAKTHGSFAKLLFNIRRIQRGTENFNLIANFSGQVASKNLSSSEKFQLGGSTGVRAYPSGEATGDHGVLFNIDGIYTLMRDSLLGNIDLISFYDWGRIQQYKNADNLILSSPNNYNLSGYGVGIKIGKPGRFDINLTVSRRIDSNPAKNLITGDDSDGSLDKTRFWFNTSLAF